MSGVAASVFFSSLTLGISNTTLDQSGIMDSEKSVWDIPMRLGGYKITQIQNNWIKNPVMVLEPLNDPYEIPNKIRSS